MNVAGGSRHADRVISLAQDDRAAVQSLVAASWRRSMLLYGLDPERVSPPDTVTAGELRAAVQEVEPLLGAAQSVLDRLFLAVAGAGCCVLLTSKDGVTIDRRGEASDDNGFRRAGLWTGAVWSEASQGTNGIGTCLAEGRALTIHHDEHFRTSNTGLSCTVAPVYDERGRLAAALDVSSCRSDLNTGLVGLIANAVADAAKAIEINNFRQSFAACRILVAPTESLAPGALVAVDGHDLVVGATRSARQALGITDARIAAQLPSTDLFHAGGAGASELVEAERGVILRALARAGGNVTAAARNLKVSRATLHRKLHRLGLSGGA